MTLVRILLLAVCLAVLAGCSAVPNMDFGSSGCQNARGIGPREGDVTDPALIGKTPSEAYAVATAAGHTVVFNVQITGFGECWCAPPPMGTVGHAWWGQNGQLFLQVDGVALGHSPNQQPAKGWGC